MAERTQARAPQADRLPPASQEAEQGVLGCVLMDPVATAAEAMSRVTPDHFYDLRHRALWEALVGMASRGEPVDLITLPQRLRDAGQLEGVGGLAYVSSLVGTVPSAAALPMYSQILEEKLQLRRLIRACTDTVARCYEDQADVQAVLDEAERAVLSARGKPAGASPDVKSLVLSSIDLIEQWQQAQGAPTGVPTGLPDLDLLTSGLQPGEMVVLAGYPSTGKTALAVQVAGYVATQHQLPVWVASLEMSARSLVLRMMGNQARVNMMEARRGRLTERDYPRLTTASGVLSRAPIHFYEESDASIYQLRAAARSAHMQHGIKLVVIDYIQLMNASGGPRRLENRQLEVADVSRGIKGMAKELGVPVLALSQLNEDGALRESRAIGQDADTVLVLKHAERPDQGDQDGQAVPVELEVRKQRNGETGVVNLVFLRQFTRFESASRVSQEDVQ